ncbi:MAG: MFS transporter [Acutalibacteraceae bacterium]
MTLVEKAKGAVTDFKEHWSTPAQGKYMPYKEVAAYAGGGIGAYFIMTLGTACILSASNVLLTSTLGVSPVDCYVMYVIAILLNIPLTGIRANIIDNTRNKAGKYRPYIVTTALPAAIICIIMVWFPYTALENIFGQESMLFGKHTYYVAKCAIILFLNILLHFFYYFFYDAYENLIHVLSPNSQERADVSAIKSVVYSLAPSIVNLITPIIASNIFHTNSTDIRVYRLLYPILTVIGLILCIIIYKNTEEKIVQARTHIIQIKFTDSLRAVAHNKYFWIISLAGWIGFLEASYANILYWLYNYGGVCSGGTYGLIVTLYGNASLWGMLLAPFAVRKYGKKMVLVVTNIFNIVFILCMLPATIALNNSTIWLVLICLYLNAFMGSFMLILNPAIQADIRDYQQYITGERIDGMFSAVATIGTVVTLASSVVLPVVYEMEGLTEKVATRVTSTPAILNRMLGDGKTVGEILNAQLENGQNNFTNANSALYDPDILLRLLHVLILFSAVGALLNVIPYIWYDFDEKKQKSVVNVLKIRAMFEDYSNGALADESLIESVDIINSSRELAQKEVLTEKEIKAKKLPKKEKNALIKENEEIEIAKFVCDELDKFSTPSYAERIAVSKQLYDAGLEGIVNSDAKEIKEAMKEAKAMPKKTKAERDDRTFMVDLQRSRKNALKAYNKYFDGKDEFVQPDMAVLDSLFEKEDKCDEKLKALYEEKRQAKKDKNSADISRISAEIKETQQVRSEVRKSGEKEMDRHAYFARAAKPYLDSKKLLDQMENYSHLEDIISKYDAAKVRLAAAE